MKDINVTSEAFLFLSRITGSCVSACKKDMEAFKKYVAGLAAAGNDMKLTDFISNSPAEVAFLRDIISFIKEDKIKILDGGAILRFFGGSWHISKILADIRENASNDPFLQKESFMKRFLFDHILTVFCVLNKQDGIIEVSFKDQYGNFKFNRKLAIARNGYDNQVKKGDVVLVHFGKIVAINPENEVLNYILREQNESDEFKKAVVYMNCNA